MHTDELLELLQLAAPDLDWTPSGETVCARLAGCGTISMWYEHTGKRYRARLTAPMPSLPVHGQSTVTVHAATIPDVITALLAVV